jgi:hypothetical protein
MLKVSDFHSSLITSQSGYPKTWTYPPIVISPYGNLGRVQESCVIVHSSSLYFILF